MIPATPSGARRLLLTLFLGCLVTAPWPGWVRSAGATASTTFTNASYININDVAIQGTTLASLYPSPIVVSGLTGTVKVLATENPKTGDVNTKDITVEVIKNNDETFLKGQSVS